MPDFPETVGGWLLDLLGFVGLGLGGAQAAAVARLDDIAQHSWSEDPHRRLTADELATMVVKGVIDRSTAVEEAHFSGYSDARFDDLVAATGNPPGPGELLDMLRRDIIDDNRFRHGIEQGLIKTEWSDEIRAFRTVPLPVDDAVHGVVQNHIDPAVARNNARAHGVDDADFAVMVENAGNPPGPQEMLDLLNRGDVDEATVDQALRESRLKDKYIDALKALRRRIFTVGEAVEAAVQGHLDYDEAAGAAQRQGVDRADFEVLYQTAGNPPGAMEALDLWRRGDIDEATVDQMLRESRLKDKYIDILKKRSRRLVPMRTITTLLNHGTITDDRALVMLRQLGFSDEDGRSIIGAAHAAHTTTAKELSLSAVRELFTENMINRADAVADLQRLGYASTVADQILALAAHEVSVRDRRATITKIRGAYLSRRIDEANASGDLDSIGVDADQRDQLLKLWAIELDNAVALLTPAQIVAAGRAQIFTPEETLTRLSMHGYSDDDALVLAMLGRVIPLPTPPT